MIRPALMTMMLAVSGGATAQPAPGAARIDLVCMGAGTANHSTSTYAYGATSDGGSGWANIVGNRSVPYDDQVNLWIDGDQGSIRMPRNLLPPVHGGNGGWFKLSSIQISDNEIRATANVNFVSSPKVRIDRITGNINIDGRKGDYSGHCSRYDPATVQRAF